MRLEKEVSITDAKTYQENLLKRDEVSNVEYVLNQSVQVMKNKEDVLRQDDDLSFLICKRR